MDTGITMELGELRLTRRTALRSRQPNVLVVDDEGKDSTEPTQGTNALVFPEVKLKQNTPQQWHVCRGT